MLRGHLYLASRLWQYAISSSASSGPGRVQQHRLHDGPDLLAELVVWDAEDRDVGNGGMGDEDVLGLLRVDVHAAGDHHVGLAVGEVEVAVLVEVADVADRRPAALVAGGRGLLGIVEVGEVEAALGPDRAGLAWRQLVAVVVEDVGGAEDRRGRPSRAARAPPRR